MNVKRRTLLEGIAALFVLSAACFGIAEAERDENEIGKADQIMGAFYVKKGDTWKAVGIVRHVQPPDEGVLEIAIETDPEGAEILQSEFQSSERGSFALYLGLPDRDKLKAMAKNNRLSVNRAAELMRQPESESVIFHFDGFSQGMQTTFAHDSENAITHMSFIDVMVTQRARPTA